MEGYECSLSAAEQEKAREELHEVAAEREEHVIKLREWLGHQTHIKCPTDPWFLLLFLRYAKFSPSKAKKTIEAFCKLKTGYPYWFSEVETSSQRAQEFLDLGYIVPLPKEDKEGRKIVILRMGCFDPSAWRDDKPVILRCLLASTYLLLLQERYQLHGIVYLLDLTGFSVGHQFFWGVQDILAQIKFFQGSFPMRFKGFHCYNEGMAFDALLTLTRPFMSTKFRQRIHLHGSSLASVCDALSPELLPAEYCPPGYSGPNQGPMSDIIETLKNDLSNSSLQERLTYISLPKWGVCKKEKSKE